MKHESDCSFSRRQNRLWTEILSWAKGLNRGRVCMSRIPAQNWQLRATQGIYTCSQKFTNFTCFDICHIWNLSLHAFTYSLMFNKHSQLDISQKLEISILVFSPVALCSTIIQFTYTTVEISFHRLSLMAWCSTTIHSLQHTPSIAFQHFPPNSARFSYATEGALFISAQLASDSQCPPKG